MFTALKDYHQALKHMISNIISNYLGLLYCLAMVLKDQNMKHLLIISLIVCCV
jgi:hypothetical protein